MKKKKTVWVSILLMVMLLGTLCNVSAKETLQNRALNINVTDASVIVKNTISNTITARYNSKYYQVLISQPDNGTWTVDISVLNSNTSKSVILYIPTIVYSLVDIDIDNAMYSGGSFKAGNIKARIDNGGLDFSLAKGFIGTVDANAYNSILNMKSFDRYKNSTVKSTCDKNSIGTAPSYFAGSYETGNFSYNKGTGANVMNINLYKGSTGSME